MSWIKDALTPLEAVGNVFDKLFTSDEEREKAKAVLEKLAMQPHILQAEINKVEASHRSLFVAGWRPFIGWVCGFNLLYLVLLRDWAVWAFATWMPEVTLPPATGLEITSELVVALLGLGGLRTFEKLTGRSK